MTIKLNTNIDSVARLNGAPRPAREVSSEKELNGFQSSQALEARLQSTPNIRADKVARARELIGDPAYPPRETMEGLAHLLAMKLGTGSENL